MNCRTWGKYWKKFVSHHFHSQGNVRDEINSIFLNQVIFFGKLTRKMYYLFGKNSEKKLASLILALLKWRGEFLQIPSVRQLG